MFEHGLVLDKEGKRFFKCQSCGLELALSSNSSSNAIRHLQEAHGIVPVSEERRQRIQENNAIKESTLEDLAEEREVQRDRFCDLQRAVVTIETMQFLNYYENPSVRLSHPGWNPISAKKITALLSEYYLSFQSHLINDVNRVRQSNPLPSFHLMLDVWLEKHSKNDYLGVRISFVNTSFELQSRLLLVTRYNPTYLLRTNNRASELVSHATKAALEAFSLDIKDIICCTTDKGPEIASAIVSQLNKDHIWCFSHLLNRVLDSSIGKKGPLHPLLQLIRNTVNTINLSTYNQSYYEELSSSTSLCNDVKERWKSSTIMMKKLLSNFSMIEETFSKRNLPCPVTGKRDQILQVYSIVLAIADIITISQRTTYNLLVESLLKLVELLETGIFDSSKTLKLVDPAIEDRRTPPIYIETHNLSEEAKLLITSIKAGLQSRLLNRYYDGHISIALDCLMFLHPNFKQSMPHVSIFIKNCDKCPQALVKHKSRERIQNVHLYIKNKMKNVLENKHDVSNSTHAVGEGDKAIIDRYMRYSDQTLSQQSEEVPNIQELVDQEFSNYLNARVQMKIDLTNDLLRWWKEEGLKFPLIRDVAASLLAIFPSSGYLERDFCFGNQIISASNSQTNDWILSMLMVLRVNLSYLPDMKDVREFITQATISENIPTHLKGLFEIDQNPALDPVESIIETDIYNEL